VTAAVSLPGLVLFVCSVHSFFLFVSSFALPIIDSCMRPFIYLPTHPPVHSSIYPPTHPSIHPSIHPPIHPVISSFILQQAADAQEGLSAHHEAEGSDSSQQALPSNQASKPFAASHVDSPTAQPEAEHDQQSALTADSEGSAAPERESMPAEQSCISEDVEVVLTPSPATEGHHAPPNTSNAEDGLTETSKVDMEGATTSSASSKPAASPPVEEEELTDSVVTADSSQAGAGPSISVIASNSPLGVQAINSFSMPAKSGQPGAVPSSLVEGPNSPQGMQDSDCPATSQVSLLKAEGIAEARTATGSAPTAAALHPTAGAKITSSPDLEIPTEVAAGTDKAAAEATMGLPPAIGHASQKAPTATASLEVRDVAAAEATTGVPPATTGAFQDVRPATTETTAGQRSRSTGLQAINSFSMPAKTGQPGAVSSSPIEGPNSPQGMQDSASPTGIGQVAVVKAEGIAQAPTAVGSVLTAAALHTTTAAKITSSADLELPTNEVAAGTDKAAAEVTMSLASAIGHASQNEPTATARLEVKDAAAAETTTDVPPAIASASQDLHPSATKTTAGPPSETAVATANVLPDPTSAGMHAAAPEARAAPNSPVVLPDSAIAVSAAEDPAGCSRDRAAADDLGVGAEAKTVPAAPAAKPKSKLKSKTKPKSKARAALEDPAADAEGDMIAAKHPAGQADTTGNASTKPKTKKRSAKTKVSAQNESASTSTLDSPDATAAGSAVRESAHATAAVEAAAVSESASSTAPFSAAAAGAAEAVQSGVEGCADSKYEVVPGDQRLGRLKGAKARKLSSGATAVVYR